MKARFPTRSMLRTATAGTAASALLLSACAMAQPVSVRVNGERVYFGAVAPQVVGNRVLVPLRGVLDSLGAYVGWNSGTQTVVASEDGRDIRLPVGSPYAWVDGRRVRLDTPAMTIAGRTMVPLRFVSEALGADVRWNEAESTVLIDMPTRSYASNGYYRSGRAFRRSRDEMPTIQSMSTNLDNGWINPGETVRVTVQGTPGGRAWFRIRGVVGEVPMTEVSSGTYVGTWRAVGVPAQRVARRDILAFVDVGRRSTPEVYPGE